MKNIISLILLITISCQLKGKLFDVEQFLSKDIIDMNGYPVKLEVCDDGSSIKSLENKVVPKEIELGSDVTLKSKVEALKKISIKKLKIQVQYNGSDIFSDIKDYIKDVEVNEKFVYTYTAAVPAFTPAGNWVIFINLVDSNGNNVSCLKASFTTK
jgi:hypothetical protein